MGTTQQILHLRKEYLGFLNSLKGNYPEIEEAINFLTENVNTIDNESLSELKGLNTSIYNFLTNKKEDITQIMASVETKPELKAIDVNDAIKEIKGRTNGIKKEFELEYQKLLSDFNKPVTGSFNKSCVEIINKISETDVKKTKRSTTIQLSLSGNATEDILNSVSNEFASFAETTMELYNAYMRTFSDTISNTYSITMNENLIAENTKDDFILQTNEIITNCMRIDKPYEGSIMQVNFKNMLFEIRSYSTMFVLLVSTLGLNKKFLNNDTFINIFYITSFTLIVFGILGTYAKNQDLKEEKMKDELKKIKTEIEKEMNRMMREFVKDFSEKIRELLNQEIPTIPLIMEDILKTENDLRAQNINTENLRRAEYINELSTIEKDITVKIANCDSYKRQINGLQTKLLNIK